MRRKCRIEIEYHWDCDEGLEPDHFEELDDYALERLSALMREGYLAGELNHTVLVERDDGDDEVEYWGWGYIRYTQPSEYAVEVCGNSSCAKKFIPEDGGVFCCDECRELQEVKQQTKDGETVCK